MDSRRIFQLWKSLSDSNHPWNKFGCGNKTTLLHEDSEGGEKETRRRVIEWWEQNYCAGRMKVAMLGSGMLENSLLIVHLKFNSRTVGGAHRSCNSEFLSNS